MPPPVLSGHAQRWFDELTLDEKAHLVAGTSLWRTPAVERLGIPAVKMTDGPNGARGERVGSEGTPAVLVPVGIAQGATWDPDLVARIGHLLAKETHRRQAHVLLAPTVNLHRTPIGGRTFECYSEDPELTAALAVAMVDAVQSHGVAVTVKHFAGNDTEIDRMSVDARIDERPLRELYLRPFEATVREAGAWGVMSAYNRLNGPFCSSHTWLLGELLRGEWGFDGFVVSDWHAAHDTAESARAGLSIEMPGPPQVYGAKLAAAVAAGEVDRSALDAIVRDVLVLIERTGAHVAERSADLAEATVDDPAERALCREAAVAGTVLARNTGVLPLEPAATVAVVGPNAADTRTQGGGSSGLRSLPQQSILEALEQRFAHVIHAPGVSIDKHAPLAIDRLIGPDGEPGLVVTVHAGSAAVGAPVHTERSLNGIVEYLGEIPGTAGRATRVVSARGAYVPSVGGTHHLGVILTGPTRITLGDTVELDGSEPVTAGGEAFYGLGAAERMFAFEATAGTPIAIEVETVVDVPIAAVRIGVLPPPDPGAFERAVDAARTADVAIVVVGTNDDWETEGHDRVAIELPGRQDELVRAVVAVNPNTVVVVNAGAPVAMPWIDEVAAVLIPFFGGMESGPAVADILVGAADPGGRLPITYPRALVDVPAMAHYAPVDGRQVYGERFQIGYRGFDASGIEPLLPFGHGLSYGAATWGEPRVDGEGPFTVTVPVSAGDRDATVVVQGYVAPIDPPVEREPKALKAWHKLVVRAGTTSQAQLTFDACAFRRWDDEQHCWTVDPGDYDLVVAASATDVRARVRVTVTVD